MVLIDTSSWIHFLRPDGDGAVRARVEALLQAGAARSCPVVRLELWNGAGGDREKKAIRKIEQLVPELSIAEDVWSEAYELARRCRAAGVTVPATDVVIEACARHHGALVEHSDGDFDEIARVVPRPGEPEPA